MLESNEREDRETVILSHDEDDPPPAVTYSDLHWWFLNRWAEWGMRSARLLGLM